MNKLLIWKENLITAGVVLVCLLLFFFFPTNDPIEKLTASFFFLFLIPLLYIKLILKKDLAEYGWQIGKWKAGVLYAALMIGFCLLVFYLLLQYGDLQEKYVLPRGAYLSFWYFMFYELAIFGFLLFLYTFFFQGFVLVSYTRILGAFSPLLPFFLFLAFLWFFSSFSWSNYGYILLSFPSPFLARRSQSIIYPLIAGLLFMLAADALIIKLPIIS